MKTREGATWEVRKAWGIWVFQHRYGPKSEANWQACSQKRKQWVILRSCITVFSLSALPSDICNLIKILLQRKTLKGFCKAQASIYQHPCHNSILLTTICPVSSVTSLHYPHSTYCVSYLLHNAPSSLQYFSPSAHWSFASLVIPSVLPVLITFSIFSTVAWISPVTILLTLLFLSHLPAGQETTQAAAWTEVTRTLSRELTF